MQHPPLVLTPYVTCLKLDQVPPCLTASAFTHFAAWLPRHVNNVFIVMMTRDELECLKTPDEE